MIEVGVSYENKIGISGKCCISEARQLEPLDHLQPFRPNRINEHIDFVRLNQKRSVSDPSDADFAGGEFWEVRLRMKTSALNEKRGNKNAS